jgi:hypothetical protein
MDFLTRIQKLRSGRKQREQERPEARTVTLMVTHQSIDISGPYYVLDEQSGFYCAQWGPHGAVLPRRREDRGLTPVVRTEQTGAKK